MNEEQSKLLNDYILADIRYRSLQELSEKTRNEEDKAWHKKREAFVALKNSLNIKSFDAQDIISEIATRMKD